MSENGRSLQETERIRGAVNSEVVRLLNEKIVPLNKGRYMHLQKIGKAVAKQTPPLVASSGQFSLNQYHKSIESPPYHTRSTQNTNPPNVLACLLLERLKIIRNQLKSQEHVIGHHKLPQLRLISSTQLPNLTSKLSIKTPKSHTRTKKQNSIDLVQRAEKYLRAKKRELKERHSKEQYCLIDKIDPFHRVHNLQSLTSGRASNNQLQLQLLRDFRESMLQGKLNRMKRQINHKKIVQMR